VSEPNVIETERLDLRRLTLNDLDALAAIYSDADVRQYFPRAS
jgi:RimJ/RimL family protein N-acetyltransferase